MSDLPRSVVWDPEGPALVLLDQTALPTHERFLRLTSPSQVELAIRSLQVRGAPAIGHAAAWGLVLGLHHSPGGHQRDLSGAFEALRALFASSRPTAVNLGWALTRLARVFDLLEALTPRDQVLAALTVEAQSLQDEDEAMGLALGEHGLTLFRPGSGLLTHCNAGAIATARWGTALAPIHLGQSRGYGFRVWADETRPLLQGARLTVWELARAGVDVTLICDNAAASVLASGKIDAVVVGCDRVAANGDAANKIGTLGLAVLAKHFGVPFYVFAPLSTVDPDTPHGGAIPIEQRRPDEVTSVFGSKPTAPEGTKVENPAFDVTPASLISAIVTERGVIRPPLAWGLAEALDA